MFIPRMGAGKESPAELPAALATIYPGASANAEDFGGIKASHKTMI
jgi:hypothetical protein